MHAMPRSALAACVLVVLPSLAFGQQIDLAVDASEVGRKVIHVREVISAAAGQLTLHYPRWIPGRHRPVGQIANVTEFRVSAGGKAIDWKRDDADPFSVRVTVPEGAKAVEVTFGLLLAAGA